MAELIPLAKESLAAAEQAIDALWSQYPRGLLPTPPTGPAQPRW